MDVMQNVSNLDIAQRIILDVSTFDVATYQHLLQLYSISASVYV